MNTPASSPASSVEPRTPRLLDRLVPVSPQWRIPARKAERLGWLQLLLGIRKEAGAFMTPVFPPCRLPHPPPPGGTGPPPPRTGRSLTARVEFVIDGAPTTKRLILRYAPVAKI